MCEEAASSMLRGGVTRRVMAELLANQWGSQTIITGHQEARFLEPWDETLHVSIGSPEYHQSNDSIATIFRWIRGILTHCDSELIFTSHAKTLWEDAPDDHARVDIESTLFFCNLWLEWHLEQTYINVVASPGDSKTAFEVLQATSGLSQMEVMSALARLISKGAGRGNQADAYSRTLNQVHHIEVTPRLRNIVTLLYAHVEPLVCTRTIAQRKPTWRALRQDGVRPFVEMHTSISKTLLYFSPVQPTAPVSELPSVSPCMVDSPRSSCSSGLRSFKSIHLHQIAQRMSKSASLRWSQLSDMSIATFSSGERWLQKHAVDPQASLLLARSTVKLTMISPPKLTPSSDTSIEVHEAAESSGSCEQAADIMEVDVEMDTRMQI